MEKENNALKISHQETDQFETIMKNIDLSNTTSILQYGNAAQSKISAFSEATLEKIKTKNLDEIGDTLSSLVVQLKAGEKTEKKGLFSLFSKSRVEQLKANYASAQANIEKICQVLEHHQIALMKDIEMLEQLYAMNQENFDELNLYISAGKKKLEMAQQMELPLLLQDANDPQKAQFANDYAENCYRFEKKLHDLELTRTISIQMAPQIRLVQNNDILMAEKIQSSLVNTIPLWKSQLVLALGIENSRQAMEVQRKVSDMTNELLMRNSELLKSATIETAKESERGIVDLETLQKTNTDLIETLDEVIKIHSEGHQKREEAELELRRIENALKNKLTENINESIG